MMTYITKTAIPVQNIICKTALRMNQVVMGKTSITMLRKVVKSTVILEEQPIKSVITITSIKMAKSPILLKESFCRTGISMSLKMLKTPIFIASNIAQTAIAMNSGVLQATAIQMNPNSTIRTSIPMKQGVNVRTPIAMEIRLAIMSPISIVSSTIRTAVLFGSSPTIKTPTTMLSFVKSLVPIRLQKLVKTPMFIASPKVCSTPINLQLVKTSVLIPTKTAFMMSKLCLKTIIIMAEKPNAKTQISMKSKTKVKTSFQMIARIRYPIQLNETDQVKSGFVIDHINLFKTPNLMTNVRTPINIGLNGKTLILMRSKPAIKTTLKMIVQTKSSIEMEIAMSFKTFTKMNQSSLIRTQTPMIQIKTSIAMEGSVVHKTLAVMNLSTVVVTQVFMRGLEMKSQVQISETEKIKSPVIMQEMLNLKTPVTMFRTKRKTAIPMSTNAVGKTPVQKMSNIKIKTAVSMMPQFKSPVQISPLRPVKSNVHMSSAPEFKSEILMQNSSKCKTLMFMKVVDIKSAKPIFNLPSVKSTLLMRTEHAQTAIAMAATKIREASIMDKQAKSNARYPVSMETLRHKKTPIPITLKASVKKPVSMGLPDIRAPVMMGKAVHVKEPVSIGSFAEIKLPVQVSVDMKARTLLLMTNTTIKTPLCTSGQAIRALVDMKTPKKIKTPISMPVKTTVIMAHRKVHSLIPMRKGPAVKKPILVDNPIIPFKTSLLMAIQGKLKSPVFMNTKTLVLMKTLNVMSLVKMSKQQCIRTQILMLLTESLSYKTPLVMINETGKVREPIKMGKPAKNKVRYPVSILTSRPSKTPIPINLKASVKKPVSMGLPGIRAPVMMGKVVLVKEPARISSSVEIISPEPIHSDIQAKTPLVMRDTQRVKTPISTSGKTVKSSLAIKMLQQAKSPIHMPVKTPSIMAFKKILSQIHMSRGLSIKAPVQIGMPLSVIKTPILINKLPLFMITKSLIFMETLNVQSSISMTKYKIFRTSTLVKLMATFSYKTAMSMNYKPTKKRSSIIMTKTPRSRARHPVSIEASKLAKTQIPIDLTSLVKQPISMGLSYLREPISMGNSVHVKEPVQYVSIVEIRSPVLVSIDLQLKTYLPMKDTASVITPLSMEVPDIRTAMIIVMPKCKTPTHKAVRTPVIMASKTVCSIVSMASSPLPVKTSVSIEKISTCMKIPVLMNTKIKSPIIMKIKSPVSMDKLIGRSFIKMTRQHTISSPTWIESTIILKSSIIVDGYLAKIPVCITDLTIVRTQILVKKYKKWKTSTSMGLAKLKTAIKQKDALQAKTYVPMASKFLTVIPMDMTHQRIIKTPIHDTSSEVCRTATWVKHNCVKTPVCIISSSPSSTVKTAISMVKSRTPVMLAECLIKSTVSMAPGLVVRRSVVCIGRMEMETPINLSRIISTKPNTTIAS